MRPKMHYQANDEDFQGGEAVSEDTHIYIYAEIGSKTAQDFAMKLRSAKSYARYAIGEIGYPYPIHVHLQSPGGDLFASFAIADMIMACSKGAIDYPVHTHVEGYCASGATLVSMAGSNRFITPNSYMLIHQLHTMLSGKYNDFLDNMKVMDDLTQRLITFYTERSTMTEDEVKAMLDRESWFNAQECLDNGFVREIR